MYDIVIIGGGPGGYSAALSAAKLGASIALVNKDGWGGTCLNRGCIPTKTYLDNVETLQKIRESSKRGIVIGTPTVDMPAMFKFKQRVIKRLSMGLFKQLTDAGIDLYDGEAQVENFDKIHVSLADGTSCDLTCKRLILATGSRPAMVPIPGSNQPGVLTSNEILDLQEIPKNLAIIGGGVIGIETARIFSAFGSKVTIIEMQPRLVENMAPEISAALEKRLKTEKITLKLGKRVTRIERVDDDLITDAQNPRWDVVIQDPEPQPCCCGEVVEKGNPSDSSSEPEYIHADKILVAVGRAPNTDTFKSLNLDLNGHFVSVIGTMQTSNPLVYAVGDINGLCMLAHAAICQGELAARNAWNSINGLDDEELEDLAVVTMPQVIYGEPSACSIGLTEAQAQKIALEVGEEIVVGTASFGANGRAVAAGMGDGFVKILAFKNCRETAGIHIFGPMASELVNEATLVVQLHFQLPYLVSSVHAHPTFGEAISAAASDAMSKMTIQFQ